MQHDHQTGLTIHAHSANLEASRCLSQDAQEESPDMLGAAHRCQRRRDLAAAIAIKNGVGRQDLHQPRQVAGRAGRDERLGQTLNLGGIGFEPRTTLQYVRLGPADQLPAAWL